MKYQVISALPEQVKTDCVIVAVMPDEKMSPAARRLDRASKGAIRRLLKRGDFTGKAGEAVMLYELSGVTSKRVLLVGCGEEGKRDSQVWNKIHLALINTLKKRKSHQVTSFLGEVAIKQRKLAWKLEQAAQTMASALYEPGEMKSQKPASQQLTTVQFAVAEKQLREARRAVLQGHATGEGMQLTRRLADLPANVCTPSYLAAQARQLARQHASIKTKVLSEAQMRKLGMNALLSVAAGSNEPARLIVLEYQGTTKKQPPIALVGKGVTFDSGGISLKPGAAMDEMKYDMCGAASVLGTLAAIARMKLPIHVVGVIPATENLPSGQATKPGDIVTSMAGKTIEILNTDAEGRLILCDALTYVQKHYKPETVIDIATLTGACIVALGHHTSGLIANDDALAAEVQRAADDSQDAAWRLPMGEDYQRQLDSNFADIANIGPGGAGTITAGCFLSRFTEDVKWAHLDIAGTAWRSGGKAKGATGRPVPLLTQFLVSRSNGG